MGMKLKAVHDVLSAETCVKEEPPQLEINYEKTRSIIGEENWKNLLREMLVKYLEGNLYYRGEQLLHKEGILSTKRENNLDNLLDI